MHNCYSVGILHKDLFALAFGSCRAANKPIFKTQSQTKRKFLKYTFKKGLVIDLVFLCWICVNVDALKKVAKKSNEIYVSLSYMNSIIIRKSKCSMTTSTSKYTP